MVERKANINLNKINDWFSVFFFSLHFDYDRVARKCRFMLKRKENVSVCVPLRYPIRSFFCFHMQTWMMMYLYKCNEYTHIIIIIFIWRKGKKVKDLNEMMKISEPGPVKRSFAQVCVLLSSICSYVKTDEVIKYKKWKSTFIYHQKLYLPFIKCYYKGEKENEKQKIMMCMSLYIWIVYSFLCILVCFNPYSYSIETLP